MVKQDLYSKKLKKRVLLGLIDIVILQIIKNKMMSGHDIIKKINKQFNVLISSGTIYPILIKLKKQKLIRDKKKKGRRIYYSTGHGNLMRRSLKLHYLDFHKNIQLFI